MITSLGKVAPGAMILGEVAAAHWAVAGSQHYYLSLKSQSGAFATGPKYV